MSKQSKDSEQSKNTEVTAVAPDASDSNNKSSEAPAKEKASKRSAAPKLSRFPLLVALLALLIALAALASTAYIGWRGKALEDSQLALQSGQEQLQSQMARQQARLTETIQSLSPVDQQIQGLQQRNDRLLNRIDVLSRHVRDIAGSHRDGWQLAEVEYLLRLANQKLLMTADVISATALLQDADTILLELDDYSLFPVREALAEDLAVLRMVPHLDQEGTYLRLSALSRRVNGLPTLQPESYKTITVEGKTETPATGAEDSNWQTTVVNMLKNTWNSFTSLFRFTADRTTPVTPLLNAEEDLLMRQNLRLLIEQAKLALLAREQGIYDDSLQQAQRWVERYFEMAGDASRGMIEELQALSSVTVSPTLPNINRALDAIKQYQSSEPQPRPEKPQPKPENPSETKPVDEEQEADSGVQTS